MKIFLLLIISCLFYPISGYATSYEELLKEIKLQQKQYQTQYAISNTAQKRIVITEARAYLVSTMTEKIFPQWYGTPWDFNGTTRIPKKGNIACGYFITNTLSDMGFLIPRVKWAQSASEVFIKKLSQKNIKRFSNRPLSEVQKHLLKYGNGLYLVGLDNHTGYVLVKNKQINFIHASFYYPKIGVLKEPITTLNPLLISRYRVFGKLFSDKMVKNWLTNKRYF